MAAHPAMAIGRPTTSRLLALRPRSPPRRHRYYRPTETRLDDDRRRPEPNVTPDREWDAIVVGLGGIGSGAAYWLSRRLGDRVLGLEQFELGHDSGASQDHSRIIRLSYHRPEYVRLAKRAYADLGRARGRGRRPGRHEDRRSRCRAARRERSRCPTTSRA